MHQVRRDIGVGCDGYTVRRLLPGTCRRHSSLDHSALHLAPIAGANGLRVIVSRDASFTTIVDYAFTNIPAYAPRKRRERSNVCRRDDAVLLERFCPRLRKRSWRLGRPVAYQSRELSEAGTAPATAILAGQGRGASRDPAAVPWTSVTGARNYRLQVLDRPQLRFESSSTMWSRRRRHTSSDDVPGPGDALLAIQANTELASPRLVGGRTFKQTAGRRPTPSADNPKSGDSIPTCTGTACRRGGYDVTW